jgi:uroporphyrinogen-III synthase
MAQKILITRPQEDAEILAVEIEALGFDVLIAPMLNIETRRIKLPDLSSFDGFVFTSVNGVRCFAALSQIRDKPVFTVGEKTAYTAMEAGFATVHSTGSDVEALAAFLKTQNGLYAHFRGQDVARSLVDLFVEDDALTIQEFVIYRAVKVADIETNILTYIQNNDISDVLFYSKRTAETFVELIQRHECTSFVQGIKALCLADSMVECLSVLPWKEIQVAAHPDQRSMMALLKTKKT